MTTTPKEHWISREELQNLQNKLREAQETLEAIQSGEVDAVVISGKAGSQIYTLTSAEEPYRVFVEQMQEGALTLSPAGVILYSNRKFSDLLGIELERVISSDVTSHFDHAVWEEIVAETGSEGAFKKESVLTTAAGALLPVMFAASRVEMSDQPVICLVVTDLSEQKEKSALAIAKEIAEAANRSKDNFIAALSHELRTPLTPALMGACLLEQDKKLSANSRLLAGTIRRNVELETRLIDDLLDLTRITQGKIELRITAVDLHQVILEAVEICRADLDDKDQQLELTLAATSTLLNGDPVRLQQILWNLLRNASKFSGRGQLISLVSRNTDNGSIEVTVTDQGIGIDAEILPQLFFPFKQGSEEVTRRFGGLGLGLAISKSIAELHEGGGIIAFSHGCGHGSTFTLTLSTLPGSEPAAAPEPLASKGRILLVEDNTDTRLMISLLLESLDYEVETASTLREGLESAESGSFDILISDVGLPDGTGLDLMQAIGKSGHLKGIAMSGYGMPGDIAKSLEAGFQIHLTKPVLISDLQAALESLQPC